MGGAGAAAPAKCGVEEAVAGLRMPSAKPQVAVRKSRKRSRRSRTDCTDVVDTYEALYNRVVSHTRAETINASFSDKELRIIMGQNKLLINNFDPATGKYTEKTKLQKAETLLTIIDELLEPSELRVQLPKPQRSSTRPVRKPKTADFKTNSDSDSSESDGRMPHQAHVQARSGSNGGIRGTSRSSGSSGRKGPRKSAKNRPKQHRPDPSLSPAPPTWSQPLDSNSSWNSTHDPYSSGWSVPEPDFSAETEHANKPPPAVCRAVARATMAAAAHAEAAYRAKMKVNEDSTPDNDVSPSSLSSHFSMNLHSDHRQPMLPMQGDGYGAPSSSSLSSGSPQRPNVPGGKISLSEWSDFSSMSNGSQEQQIHGPTPPHQLQYPPMLEPMQSHHLTQPQQQVNGSRMLRSPLQPPRLELSSSAQPEAPWHVSDSLTSPIPPLIYTDECQLNEVHEEPGSARVPLEETTNSPKSQNLAAELEREAAQDVSLGW